MPPRFSGLGVRVVALPGIDPCEPNVGGGAGDKRAEFGGGEVMCLPISLLELFFETYDGLFGRVRVRAGGAGLAID